MPPLPVANLTLRRLSHYVTLNWQSGAPAADGDIATYYVLYRFDASERATPRDPRRILALPRPAPGYPATFVDTTAVPGQAYAYYVTSVDRLHNESRPMRVITAGQPGPELAVGQPPAGAPRPMVRPSSPPVATAPVRPQPVARPTAPRETPVASAPFSKVKVKEKPAKRGFFARLFGRK